MDLIKSALRKPITIMVLVAALLFFGIRALRGINIDIFPALDMPVIYISQPFGGYTPDQMETYFAKNYVNNLLNVSGVKGIESRNIQGLMLLKVTFYPGTDMGQAEAELIGYCNRTQATFPPGSQPPYIMRFDASALPVGQLILSSPKRTAIELQDLANIYLRPGFSQIPGLVSPPPFGANARTVVIRIDPNLLRAHNLSPDQVVKAVTDNNQTTPAGNVRIGNTNYLTPTNTTVAHIEDFNNIPIHKGGGVPNVYIRDIGHAEDGADVTAGYVLVNGKRSVYLPITKTPTASTWQTVNALKKAMPKLAAQLPPDVTLNFEFDQSVQVMNSVKSLVSEGVIGALLTGLMVLLFLKDIRGALIVIMTIPICIISSILFLSFFTRPLT